MKIIKLAAGIPSGFVKLRITIDKAGNFRRELVRESQSACKEGDSKTLIDDILNVNIPGYIGRFGEVDDAGKTKEFYDQTRVKPMPLPETPEEDLSPIQPQQPQRAREYGV